MKSTTKAVTSKMIDPSYWPSDYFASRSRFIELGNACGADMASHLVTALGPEGQSLTVDIAALISSTDEHLIIVTSGVHGIEGFLGASIQMQALQSFLTYGLPDKTGIVMVHAANPWGYAHLRRVDSDNIDINRNFFEPNNTAPASHQRYASLNPIINPTEAPNIAGELNYWFSVAKLVAKDRGVTTLIKPIAEGQYDFPKGLFFGGRQVSESSSLLQHIILSYSANADRVSVLDVHSGLGRAAEVSLIGNSNIIAQESQSTWLSQHFKKNVYIDSDVNNAYCASATFSQWCQRALNDKQYLYLCLEIGTVKPLKLFNALRRENQAHHWAGCGHDAYYRTKQSLLEVFAPKSQRWKNASTAQGIDVLHKAFELTSGELLPE